MGCLNPGMFSKCACFLTGLNFLLECDVSVDVLDRTRSPAGSGMHLRCGLVPPLCFIPFIPFCRQAPSSLRRFELLRASPWPWPVLGRDQGRCGHRDWFWGPECCSRSTGVWGSWGVRSDLWDPSLFCALCGEGLEEEMQGDWWGCLMRNNN